MPLSRPRDQSLAERTFPVRDPLRNDNDQGSPGHGIEPRTSCLRFRLWDCSNVLQPEGRGDGDAGEGVASPVRGVGDADQGFSSAWGAVVFGAGAG